MRQVTTFWFKVTSIEEPDSITDDIETEINAWATQREATIVSTSMCVEPMRNVLYVIVVYDA